MSLIFEYRNLSSDTELIDFTDRVDLSGGNVTITENAEELTVGSSTFTVDDPLGDWDIHGHAYIRIRETEAPNDLVWAGFVTIRHIARDGNYGPGGRTWKMTLDDVNTVIARRIMTQDSANRPAETDVERIQWLFDESWLGVSDAYFSTDDPVDMDAADCRGTTVADIVNDCLLQATGKNAFQQDTNDGSGGYIGFTFYGPNGADIDVLTSDLRISNYLEDIDAWVGDLSGPGTAWTWGASDDTDLERDPTRVYWKIVGQYDGGKVVRTRPLTASHFAARETTASWPLVKTATQANARADRQLDELSTEEDVITTTILVHAYHINDARPGARISCRFSHLPGYEDWSWMRILNRTVKLITPDVYSITYTLSAVPTVPVPSILVAFINKGGVTTSEPTDNSDHPWTSAFWTGNYSSLSQFPGPGGPGAFGIWYRELVDGEDGTAVIDLDNGGSDVVNCWVYQIAGVTLEDMDMDFGVRELDEPDTWVVDSPSAAVESVWFAGFMLQKVNYGQFTEFPTAAGTEFLNANGVNVLGVCDTSDTNPPKAWGAWITGTGVLEIGMGPFDCYGSTPAYNLFGCGFGGLLLKLVDDFSIVQEGFNAAQGAPVVVDLPGPP